MSFSFGFYNAVDHDRRYDAVQMSEIFDGIINDGVYATYGDHFIVKASTNNNEVIVGSGRAWFDHTWNKNDADIPITAPDPELLLKRIDALVIDVNSNIEYRTNSLIWVQGEPSVSNPVKPTLLNEPSHHQHPLAYVTRNANAIKINDADIENVVGTDECPFVTGIIETVSTSELVRQWAAQFADWMAETDQSFDNWRDTQMADFSTWSTEQRNAFATWMNGEKTDFIDWFENLQYTLDGDVAGHLQNEIDEINGKLNGSIFRIHTNESTLIGEPVTVTGSTQSKSAIFDSNGDAVIYGITDIGYITIYCTDGTFTFRETREIDFFSNYYITSDFWDATINIITISEDLYGEDITVKKGDDIMGHVTFDNTGHAQYIATEPGRYTFIVIYEGEPRESGVTVTDEGTYTIKLDVEFDLAGWLTAGGLDPADYDDLDDVLADEKAIRQLFTVHASVDFLSDIV